MTPLLQGTCLAILAWTGSLHAAELKLPASEAPADWQEAVLISGLASVPGTARFEAGSSWQLLITRPDGTTVRRTLPPPTTPAAREAAVILAASLLRPVASTTLPLTLPPMPEPEPKPEPRTPATPRPPPAPEPVAPPDPVPPFVAPVPVAVKPTAESRLLRVTATIGAASRMTTDQGAGVGTLASATVQGSGPWLIDVGASWIWTPRIDPDFPDRDLVVTSIWTSGGWHVRPPWPAVMLSVGGTGRRYRLEGTEVGVVDVPWLGTGVLWDPPGASGRRGGLRLSLRAERDLRRTVLANLDGSNGPISPWGLCFGITGRWGPALGTRDTTPRLSSARQEKSPSP